MPFTKNFLQSFALIAVLSVPALADDAHFGLACGFADADNMPILCQITPAHYRATGYGILNFAGCVMGGVMNYVVGALKDANVGLEKIFQLYALGVMLAGLLLLFIKPQKNLISSAPTEWMLNRMIKLQPRLLFPARWQ